MKQINKLFHRLFYIRNETLPLTCIHTAYAKLGGGSVIKIKIHWLFILYCTRLALLCFAKLGGGSAIKIKIHWLFILYCTRLALTLHSKTTQRTHIRK